MSYVRTAFGYTVPQEETLAEIRRVGALHGSTIWFRARAKGERPVLVNLMRHRFLVRRCHRGVEGHPDAAHEYQFAQGWH